MLSEYSFGISNLVLKFLPMVGSAPSWSSSRPLASLTSLSFFIIKLSVWVSPTPTPRTKIFIDVHVDGTWLKLSGGISSGPSVAVQPNNGFSVLQIRRIAGCFVPPSRQPQGFASTPVSSGLCFLFFESRFVLGPILFLACCDLLAKSAHCRL